MTGRTATLARIVVELLATREVTAMIQPGRPCEAGEVSVDRPVGHAATSSQARGAYGE